MTTVDGKVAARGKQTSGKPNHGNLPICLVLQGGGALGAYQAGVYEAMAEAGMQPDWVIGTSIGAINASLIAGNKPEDRLRRLKEFWRRMERDAFRNLFGDIPFIGREISSWMTIFTGMPKFFEPNLAAFGGASVPLGPEKAGYYSTDPMRKTLTELVDFDLINDKSCRLTVGAANVRTAKMHYFDSRDMPVDLRHIMASGALPPAFPPVLIDDELYWDGGICSNTPVEAVFDDNPRRDSLIFDVHVWNPSGEDPKSIAEVLHRQKDVQYSSRAYTHILRQQQLHRLRHIIAELSSRLDPAVRAEPEVKAMAAYGCLTRMHVVRLLAPRMESDSQFKDIDFSPAGIRARWKAGLDNMRDVIARAPWNEPFDALDGCALHEAIGD